MDLSNYSNNDLWRKFAGFSAKPGDTDHDLVARIVGSTGSFTDLLKKWVGPSAKSTDSDWDLVRRKTGSLFLPGDTINDMLKKVVVWWDGYSWPLGSYSSFSVASAASEVSSGFSGLWDVLFGSLAGALSRTNGNSDTNAPYFEIMLQAGEVSYVSSLGDGGPRITGSHYASVNAAVAAAQAAGAWGPWSVGQTLAG
jgi:hypothetical protein